MDIILTQIICSVAAATGLLKLQLTVLLLLLVVVVVVLMVLVGWCFDDAVEVQLLEMMTDFAEDD